jgi:hypothetical protein
MISTIQDLMKPFFIAVAITACLPIATSHAQTTFAYVSATGSGSTCTATQPCSSLNAAINVALTNNSNNGQIVCLGSVNLSIPNTSTDIFPDDQTLKIDCPAGAYLTGLSWGGSNETAKLRNVTFTNLGVTTAIRFTGSGTLILENCVFEESTKTVLDIEPNGPLNLVIRNSRISNNASGMLLKPAAGGSINATFDHVVITNNNGGGIKSDSTNGVVNMDVSDSEISNNGGNGINLVGSASQNMLNLSRTVIAKNGVAGLQVNGATTAVLVDTTLFDTNTSGATSVVGGGHVLTYANNRIVGSSGSGFTGTAPLN